MSTFIKKPSLSEKRHQHYFNPWGMKEVVEAFGGGKSFEQVKAEQKELRKKKEK